MAFNLNGLKKILDLGFASTGGGSFWLYTSTDTHATCEAANYFSGAGFGSPSSNSVGMRVNDLVIVQNVSTAGSSACTLHSVSSLSSSTGWHSAIHASISAASS